MASTASSSSNSANSKSTKTILFEGMGFWTETIKFYSMIVVMVLISIFLGFSIGTVVSKKSFDQSAIESGHAHYHPVTGKIEWKTCGKP